MTHPLLPDLPGFFIEHVSITDGVILVLAQSQRESAACPDCAHLSSRIHSRYQRKLADLPCSGHSVRLVVQVCRFFCKHPRCPRTTFAEPIPVVASRYARRTTRLKEVLEHLGLFLGGEPASRLTTILGMTCSPTRLSVCSTVSPTLLSSRLVWSVWTIGLGARGFDMGRSSVTWNDTVGSISYLTGMPLRSQLGSNATLRSRSSVVIEQESTLKRPASVLLRPSR